MAPKKVKQVVHAEYTCGCGATLTNVTDASIKLHLNGAAHRESMDRRVQAADAYTSRTYDCDCGLCLTNVTQYQIDQHCVGMGCRSRRLVGQRNLGDMGVQPVLRDFAFDDSNVPYLAPHSAFLKGHERAPQP